MTDTRLAPSAATSRRVVRNAILKTGILTTGLALALAGCAHEAAPGPAASRLRTYAVDLSGAAKVCEVPNLDPVAGKESQASMTVANTGGWCGLPLHQEGPKPFAAGLLEKRPAHGDVLIHEVGDDTRIDYTPERGFTGDDSFVVKLLPGDATVRVAVKVMSPTAAAKS